METRTQPQDELEGAGPSALYGQGTALVAMVACNLVFLLMLAA